MSQAGISGGGSSGAITTILTDDTTANNANGIDVNTVGDTATILLTNRITGSGSTVGAVTTDLATFSLGATPSTFTFEATMSGFESTTPAGAGYNLFGTVRTDGASATLVGTPDKIVNEEAALTGCDANIVVSANTVIFRVTGTAGLTVNWNFVGYYTRT